MQKDQLEDCLDAQTNTCENLDLYVHHQIDGYKIIIVLLKKIPIERWKILMNEMLPTDASQNISSIYYYIDLRKTSTKTKLHQRIQL